MEFLNANIKSVLHKEVSGISSFGWAFLFMSILAQIAVYITSGDSIISLVCGITGMGAVILCSARKFSFYILSWIQLILYVILAWRQHFWGEIIENGFYAVTMIIGMFAWVKNYKNNADEAHVNTRSLSARMYVTILLLCGISVYVLSKILMLTNDTQPIMDAISTVPAFIAQILMMLRYKENWVFWMIIDVASIFMWGIAGDASMVTLYILWTINCIYGLVEWGKK